MHKPAAKAARLVNLNRGAAPGASVDVGVMTLEVSKTMPSKSVPVASGNPSLYDVPRAANVVLGDIGAGVSWATPVVWGMLEVVARAAVGGTLDVGFWVMPLPIPPFLRHLSPATQVSPASQYPPLGQHTLPIGQQPSRWHFFPASQYPPPEQHSAPRGMQSFPQAARPVPHGLSSLLFLPHFPSPAHISPASQNPPVGQHTLPDGQHPLPLHVSPALQYPVEQHTAPRGMHLVPQAAFPAPHDPVLVLFPPGFEQRPSWVHVSPASQYLPSEQHTLPEGMHLEPQTNVPSSHSPLPVSEQPPGTHVLPASQCSPFEQHTLPSGMQ